MKNTNIEVEGGEILIQSKEGHYAVIPAKHRQEVMDMVKDGCDGCINSYIQGLPKEADYAQDGAIYPVDDKGNPTTKETYTQWGDRIKKLAPNLDYTKGKDYNYRSAYEGGLEPEFVKEDNSYHLGSRNPKTGEVLKSKNHPTFNHAMEEDFKAGYETYEANDGKIYSNKRTDYDPKNVKSYLNTYDGGTLNEAEITAKKQYDYHGCVSGMCNSLAEKNKKNAAKYRSLNNLYGDAWKINNNIYGENIDYSNPANLKENDVVNLSRESFPSDKKKGIPDKNQHIGYVSKIVDGVPYIKHYISNVGVKSDGKTPYGEYFEEPYNNIKEKYKYTVSGAKRLDSNKELDYADSNFKYDDNYKPNTIEEDFGNLHKNKKDIQEKLRLTSSEYDELAKTAYGIMGNESSFGRSSKTLYRMAVPDYLQKAVKVGLDVKRGVDVYDDNVNNLSQGYSSTKESSLHNIAANDGSTDFKKLNKRIKEGDYDGIERTGNYLRSAFEELGINADNLEDGTNSGKAILATLAWYKKRNPNATTEDLLKMYTGKKDITKYKEMYDNYQKNINSNPNDNLEYNWKDKMYGNLSNVFNKTYSTTKELNSNVVGVIRDNSPLPAQYNALIANVLQGKTTISEKSLSSSNMQQLKELVKTNVAKGKFNLEYNDYQTVEDKNSDVDGSEGALKAITKSFINDAYILKTLLGQATIVKIDDNTYDVIDSFDFNDKGKSFGIFDDLKKRGVSPYAAARSVGRNLGSSDGQGQQVRIRIKLD